jgi:prophage maintenance system killer protein
MPQWLRFFFYGTEIAATIDEQERIIMTLASGQMNGHQLTEWLNQHVRPATDSKGV